MFKSDATVLHFTNPKVQASLGSNVFSVTGHGEIKQVKRSTILKPGEIQMIQTKPYR